MKQFRSYVYQSSADFTRAMLWEAKYIFRDKAVFFSFVIVAIAVSFLYTYLYSEETLQKLPIGVVDEDNTAQSRQLLRMIDANSGVAIYSSYLNLSEAQKAFQQEKIRGIVTVPKGFSRDLQRGEQPSYSSQNISYLPQCRSRDETLFDTRQTPYPSARRGYARQCQSSEPIQSLFGLCYLSYSYGICDYLSDYHSHCGGHSRRYDARGQ